jgi:glycosyltransferase involved in cell wall biosynthesis
MSKTIVLSVINDLTIDQRMHRICTTLTQNGYDVLLVGTKKRFSKPLIGREYRTARIPLWIQKGKFFYLEFNVKLFFYLLFTRADIVTSNDLDTLLPSYIVSKLRGKELIYDSHEYFTEMPELDHRPLTKKMWLALERFLFPKLKKVSTVNQSIADIYQKLYGIPVSVVRNVPFHVAEVHKVPKQNIVLYQGNINLSRGIDIMLKALQQLDDIVFWCVGPGDLLADMKAMSVELGVQDKVKFWGEVPFQQLRELTNQAKIGISIEQPIGLNSALCLPNKLLDYVQSRLPVIVSDLPEMRALVEKYGNGVVLSDRNPDTLAKEIKQLIHDEERLQLYASNSDKAATDLCWENEQAILLSLYQ